MTEIKKYGVILADPPWRYKTWSGKGRNRCPDHRPFKGSSARHYEVMTFLEIAALPVRDLAADDCALLLWVTDPMLPRGLELLEAWGFRYKTVGFYWVKLNKLAKIHRFADGEPGLIREKELFTGLGYWTRANPEQCLLATRGHPKQLAKDVPRLVVAPRREHSRKPDEVRDRIRRLLPGPYLELFARERAEGWDAWGDEVGKFSK
ncbi:hypothetical protein LCGC14_1361910 [marine sediment metagenome]|uniref:DNA methyltransferase n=1 Tax=marine sediment metagenome TaxID=412755 RepID=A0A0F9K7W8_9ZZZZ